MQIVILSDGETWDANWQIVEMDEAEIARMELGEKADTILAERAGAATR